MGSPRSRRASVLLLLLLLGGSGGGLPLLDAALHHMGVVRRAGAQMHGCDPATTHAERCTLGIALPAFAGAARTEAHPMVAASRREPRSFDSAPPVLAGVRSPALPRAPPLSLA